MQPMSGPSTPSTTLADNRRLVIDALRRADQDLTRADIGRISGLSPAATARITDALEADRLIARTGQSPSAGGRRAWRYAFTASGRYLAGVRVQREGCRGVLVDLNNQVVDRSEVAVDPGRWGDEARGEAILDATVRCVGGLQAAADLHGGRVIAYGVAVPAVTDRTGRVSAGLEVGWSDLPLRSLLEDGLDAPVVVENDANALAYSELRPGDVGASLAAIILGYGLGAGLISQGTLLRGAHQAAGEIGYLLTTRRSLAEPRGAQGDLERRIQAVAAADPAAALIPTDRLWVLLGGDPATDETTGAVLDYLAMAVASLVTIVDPERVVLGDIPDGVGDRVIAGLQARLEGLLLHAPRLELARHGSDAVVLGAALLAGAPVDIQAI